MENASWYDKYHKIIVIIPTILFILALAYLFYFSNKNGDIIHKDITLTGGTTLTVNSPTDLKELNQFLQGKLSEFDTREISDLGSGKQIAFIVDSPDSPEIVKKAVEDYLGYPLDDKTSSIEFTGSSLSGGFYAQLRIAMIVSFLLMSLVVFLIFRTFIPSFTVIYCAFVDIVMTLATVDLLGIKVSSAGIVAFLMLIGYSVDSDILLTSRVLKRGSDSLNSTIYEAFKTGLTMTLTALVAVVICFFITGSLSQVLHQIFLILSIGLFYDIFNTWITNASILKWYVERKQ